LRGRESTLEYAAVFLLILGGAFYFNPAIAIGLILAASSLKLYVDLRWNRVYSWLPLSSIVLSTIAITFLIPPFNQLVGGGTQLALLLTSILPIGVDMWKALGGLYRKLMIVSLLLIAGGILSSALYGEASSISILSQDLGSSQMIYELIILSPYSAMGLVGLILYIALMVDLLGHHQSV
jgi:hypothetical protein